VPTVALVDQQCIAIASKLRSECSVFGIAGGELLSNEKTMKILSHHVTVCTPAIFYCLLLNDEPEQLYFTDFDLLIFDECHWCTGDDCYASRDLYFIYFYLYLSMFTEIMRLYQDQYVKRNFTRQLAGETDLPQVCCTLLSMNHS
jgi:hypothetical protein